MAALTFGNRYQLTNTAFSGGSGDVIVCFDPNLERQVAIKFMQAGSEKRRIFDEIAALQQIRSNHVVDVYDIVIEPPGNRVGVVQEFLPGTDLRAVAQTRPTLQDYLLRLYQIACGISDIHAQGLIHRDIKPNNMKFGKEGLIKIFDFDLTRTDGPNAQTLGFKGTPGYAAPELYQFGPVPFTQAVDVYAFGATALYLAEGSLPAELTNRPPVPVQWVNTKGFGSITVKLPSAVVRTLNSCLSAHPTSRPKMHIVRDIFAEQLLRDRHRALIVHNGRTAICDKTSATITISKANVGSIDVHYNGLHFVATSVSGDVWLNNVAATVGARIPGSCVVSLGGPSLKAYDRTFVTIDISHPEVVL